MVENRAQGKLRVSFVFARLSAARCTNARFPATFIVPATFSRSVCHFPFSFLNKCATARRRVIQAPAAARRLDVFARHIGTRFENPSSAFRLPAVSKRVPKIGRAHV